MHAIVLAAGASRRYGSPKQLLRHRGETLIARSVRLARLAGADFVHVVLGYRAEQIRPALQWGYMQSGETIVLRNARWRDGMGRSLACGVRALDRRAQGLLVCLADQPLVEAGDLARLVRVWRSSPGCAVASRYGGKHGVPAIFPRACFRALRSLSGDRGAQAILATLADVRSVPMPGAAADIDEPQDLANFQS